MALQAHHRGFPRDRRAPRPKLAEQVAGEHRPRAEPRQAEAADDASVEGGGKKSRRTVSSTDAFICIPCRKLKLRCDRQFPCSRCFRLGQECRPPAAFLDALQRERRAAEAVAAAGGLTLVDVAVKGKNPLLFAQEFLSIFHDRLQEGAICRERTRRMLKTYREASRRVQRDVTFGIGDGVARTLGFSPWELQDPEEILRDRRGGSPGARAEEAALREALAGSASFRLVASMGEDGRRPGPGMIMASTPVGPNFLFVSVPGSEGTGIYDATDIYTMMPRHMMLTMLLFAGIICPEDRKSWFELTCNTIFCSGYRTCSRFIKAFNRDGEIALYLMTSKMMRFDDFGHDVLVVTCEPAPKSKYVQPLPGHPHRVVNQFRHAPGMEGPTTTAAGDAAAAATTKGRGGGRRSRAASSAAEPVQQGIDPSSVPSVSHAQPPAWLRGPEAEQGRFQLLAAGPGGQDLVSKPARGSKAEVLSIPGLAAVPAPEAGDWPAPSLQEETALGRTLGQVANPSARRSPLPAPGGDPLAPRAMVQQQHVLYQQQHRPTPSRPPPPTPVPTPTLALPVRYVQEQQAQLGQATPVDVNGYQHHHQQHHHYQQYNEEDAASVLEALEMMGHGRDGYAYGEVPVLVSELDSLFAHDEGSPPPAPGPLYEHEQQLLHHEQQLQEPHQQQVAAQQHSGQDPGGAQWHAHFPYA